ncbi:Sec-independent protein translocase subunit TatA [Corynebacterium sp. A21]|uniref:Sec-independent protein translocase subunit TatA n=1 Tax=Corynebacterium sp. A21 TaxID=3457318 RepID=UPI003FD0A888
MTGIGPAQLLIIALIFVVLFGAKRLPDAARALGRSLRIFKAEVRELEQDKPTGTAN